MGKSSKKAKMGKKAKPKKKLWCTEDLDFDEDGNLCITNPALSKAIKKAIYRTDRRFRIRVHCTKDVDRAGGAGKFVARAAKKGDPLDGKQEVDPGRPPMDAMCPC